MTFADLDTVRIHYQLVGDASLPTLVLSHSLGVNLAMWEPQIIALSSRFRLLLYDTRGHGKSSIPTGPYTIADLGRDVLGLLDALSIQQASFCGLSMGGVIGQWLGVNASSRLHSLVLANTAAKIGTEETWNARIATVLRDGLNVVIPGTLERWFTPAFHTARPEVITATRAMLQATSVQGYTACCAAIRDADFRASLQAVKIPALIITGALDPVSPQQDGHFLSDNIAGARYVELPSAHLSNVEAANGFNETLLGFLKL